MKDELPFAKYPIDVALALDIEAEAEVHDGGAAAAAAASTGMSRARRWAGRPAARSTAPAWSHRGAPSPGHRWRP
jgi:hypothetical protein